MIPKLIVNWMMRNAKQGSATECQPYHSTDRDGTPLPSVELFRSQKLIAVVNPMTVALGVCPVPPGWMRYWIYGWR